MSIAGRITQIEQHIGNAYDKIEDLGIDLTDVDKNINNISAMLENVWDEYPKVSATDVEEASLNGTKKGRMEIDLKGNTEQDGEPTPESPIPIKNVTGNNNVKIQNKNLFDFDYILQHKNDFVKGSQYFMFLKLDDSFKKQFTVSTILKGTSQNFVMGFSDTVFPAGGNDKRTLNNGTVVSPKTFDFTNATNVYVFFGNGSTISDDRHEIDAIYNNYNIQLEKGTTATSYVPHQEQNYPFTFAEGQRGMQGTQLLDDGIHQKRKQKIYDGTENWLAFTSQGKTAYYINLLDGTGQEVKCSHFICQVGGGFPEKNKVLYNGTTNKNIIFYTGDTENKLTEWKAFLAEQYANGTPVILEYELEDEEIIPYNSTQQAQYNAIKQAKSYDDQTNISQTNDNLPFILDIEALKGGN